MKHYPVLAALLGLVSVSVANPTETDGPWIDIISEQGPVGIAAIGRHVKVCGDVRLIPDAKNLSAIPGDGVVAVLGKVPFDDVHNLVTKGKFADCEVRLEFLMGRNSNSGVKLQHRYEIQLFDSHRIENPSAKHCGGIYPHWVFQGPGEPLKYIDKGIPPKRNAAKPAGEWQTLQIVFRAPRFDSAGEKTENARFVLVKLNGKTIHHDVEVDSPTGNASTPLPEVAEAPLMLQMDHGAAAFRNVRVKPLEL
ncbi:DUF1080 domain-containing protein [Pirellulales bacterium]|nr:DUF1080 domain-containing protein [Pirellulales bacterium]